MSQRTAALMLIIVTMMFLLNSVQFFILTANAKEFGRITVVDAGISRWADSCKSPCSLPEEFSQGGNVMHFANAALVLAHHKKALIVKTKQCASACTLLVDNMQALGRDVCISQKTVLGFHKGTLLYSDGTKKTFDLKYQNPMMRELIGTMWQLPEGGEVQYVGVEGWGMMYPACEVKQ